MATTEDVARLILSVQGQADVDRLTEAINKEREALLKLIAAHGRQDPAVQASAGKMADLRKQLETAEKAAGKAAGGMAGLGQAGLQTGRVIQDFAQGGIGGILNNLEGLSMALGGGPGLAGLLTALGVGFFLLKPHIAGFVESLMGADRETEILRGSLGRLEERIKELEGKTIRLPVDTLELENARRQLQEMKDGLAAFEQAGKTRSHYQRESGKAVEEILAESPEGEAAIRDRIYNQLVREAEQQNPDLREARATIAEASAKRDAATRSRDELMRMGDAEGSIQAAHEALQQAARVNSAEAIISAARADIEESVKETTGNVLKGAKEGREVPQKQLADLLRKAGMGGLAGSVEDSSPEAIEQYETIEDATERSIERQKAGFKAQQARRKRIQQKREEAGRLAEQDPEAKRIQAQNDKRFGGIGRVGVSLEDAVNNVAKGREADAAKAVKADQQEFRRDDVVPAKRRQQVAEERYTEGLARQVFAGSAPTTGVQFTPDQSRDVARRSVELQKQGVDANQATLAAMGEALGAMAQLRADLMRQMAMARQLGQGFGDIRRAGQAPSPPNMPMGSP